MSHVPYGYKIENGIAYIDEPVAEKIRALFQSFIACKSMRAAAAKVGIEKTHSVVGRLIKNDISLVQNSIRGLSTMRLFTKQTR